MAGISIALIGVILYTEFKRRGVGIAKTNKIRTSVDFSNNQNLEIRSEERSKLFGGEFEESEPIKIVHQGSTDRLSTKESKDIL